MSESLPYDLTHLTGAAVRPILFPVEDPSAAVPDGIEDFLASISPYAATAPGFDVGATAGPCQVSRNMTTTGYTIEQSQQMVLEEPNEITYTVQIPFAELRPEILALSYQGKIETRAAAVGRAAAKKTTFGSVEDLDHFRIALVARRRKSQGVVQEGAGAGAIKRGRYLVYVGFDCTIMAENVQTSIGRAALAQMPVTFKLYPIASKPEGEEHGFWYAEDAGTIATV